VNGQLSMAATDGLMTDIGHTGGSEADRLSPVIPTIVDKSSLSVEIIPISYFRVTHRPILHSVTVAIVSLLWLGTTCWRSDVPGPNPQANFGLGWSLRDPLTMLPGIPVPTEAFKRSGTPSTFKSAR
jgi:hypothetical protein